MGYELGERIRLPDGTIGSVIGNDYEKGKIEVISYINGEKVIRSFPYETFGLLGPHSRAAKQKNQNEIRQQNLIRLRQEQERTFGKPPAEVARIIRPFQEVLRRREDLRGSDAFRYAQRLLSSLIRDNCKNDSEIEETEIVFENLRNLRRSQRNWLHEDGNTLRNPVSAIDRDRLERDRLERYRLERDRIEREQFLESLSGQKNKKVIDPPKKKINSEEKVCKPDKPLKRSLDF